MITNSELAAVNRCTTQKAPGTEGIAILETEQISRSAECCPPTVMEAKGLTPILNVSDIASTVTWLEKWRWEKLWDWGTPPTFAAFGSGKETCIFLCQGAQGGPGPGREHDHVSAGRRRRERQGRLDVGVGDDVDEMHKHCVAAGLEVTFPPTDMPWHVREMQLRHPDGDVFRVSWDSNPKN